jgi:hypothetical protein
MENRNGIFQTAFGFNETKRNQTKPNETKRINEYLNNGNARTYRARHVASLRISEVSSRNLPREFGRHRDYCKTVLSALLEVLRRSKVRWKHGDVYSPNEIYYIASARTKIYSKNIHAFSIFPRFLRNELERNFHEDLLLQWDLISFLFYCKRYNPNLKKKKKKKK